jgi:hypothetical protein
MTTAAYGWPLAEYRNLLVVENIIWWLFEWAQFPLQEQE